MKLNYFKPGFTIVEVMLSMVISAAVFWGLMTLYVDVAENHTRDQIIEEIRFNLTIAMDRIVEDVRGADSVSISSTPFSRKIKIMEIDNQTGRVSEEHSYSSKDDEGILYDEEPISLPGRHLFNDDGPYTITIEDFEFEATLNDYDTSEDGLQENFYDLTVIFKLSKISDETFERIFTFEQRLFSLNKFATRADDDET